MQEDTGKKGKDRHALLTKDCPRIVVLRMSVTMYDVLKTMLAASRMSSCTMVGTALHEYFARQLARTVE